MYPLIIFSILASPHDAGKYCVRAVNAGGEAESIADFLVIEPTPDRMIEMVKTTKIENADGLSVSVDNFKIFLYMMI